MVRFTYSVDRARDQYSNAVAGLVAGGKERNEDLQTQVQKEDKHPLHNS